MCTVRILEFFPLTGGLNKPTIDKTPHRLKTDSPFRVLSSVWLVIMVMVSAQIRGQFHEHLLNIS